MARYTGPKCRVCRRVGTKLFLKGNRCETLKCAIEKNPLPPGKHLTRRLRLTDYALHLQEVQRAKKGYGLGMRQMRRYFKEALRQPGNTAEYLLQLLERRLDNVIYCLRFALSRAHARQLITHGHIRVNQVRVRSPSYWVQAGDVLTPGPKDRSKKMISESIRTASRDVPSWLKLREDPPQGTVLQLPTKQDLRVPFNPQLIVEYMSR